MLSTVVSEAFSWWQEKAGGEERSEGGQRFLLPLEVNEFIRKLLDINFRMTGKQCELLSGVSLKV
jgi:hypothetical protein